MFVFWYRGEIQFNKIMGDYKTFVALSLNMTRTAGGYHEYRLRKLKIENKCVQNISSPKQKTKTS